MRKSGTIDPDDPVVFMDGDSIIIPGMLRRCVPLFAADPDLQALTTDEEVVVHGPHWVRLWLEMRFAQRRITMQSHALSGKVLTLTGRLSLFRAHNVIHPDFIMIVEEDHIHHWLWGRFRFLSGDDKSTWYYLLTKSARMIYVPDALALTVEHIEGTGVERMVQNMQRWSGNMLRNGARAIALGPRRVGPFIWWCVVDQRVSIWTMLMGPTLAVCGAIIVTPWFIVPYLTWVLGTRMLQSCMLYSYSRKIRAGWPGLLFAAQIMNAAVKVYSTFRPAKQRWANRGDQRLGFAYDRRRQAVAGVLTTIAVLAVVVMVTTTFGLVDVPSAYTFMSLLERVNWH
jgi:mannuronan synthase